MFPYFGHRYYLYDQYLHKYYGTLDGLGHLHMTPTLMYLIHDGNDLKL